MSDPVRPPEPAGCPDPAGSMSSRARPDMSARARPYTVVLLLAAGLAAAAVGATLRPLTNPAEPAGTGLGAPAAAGAHVAAGAPSPEPAAAAPSGLPSAAPTSLPPAPPVSSPPSVAPPVSAAERAENDVITLVNAERRKANCDPVHLDTRLRTAARGHSADMAAHNYFSHTGRDGSSPWDRARRAGYTQASGENIAYGYRTAADVMRGWMNSEGHRNNILNCASRAIGVGLAHSSGGTPYWTQMFGRA